jgi:hypothetical protein
MLAGNGGQGQRRPSRQNATKIHVVLAAMSIDGTANRLDYVRHAMSTRSELPAQRVKLLLQLVDLQLLAAKDFACVKLKITKDRYQIHKHQTLTISKLASL